MDDQRIVELYWQRSEQAIAETSTKYGKYCYSIAHSILGNIQDAEESVNDTYHEAWNSMPPHRPSALATFLGKITRRISIDKYRRKSAQKRGGGQLPLVMEELSAIYLKNGKLYPVWKTNRPEEIASDLVYAIVSAEIPRSELGDLDLTDVGGQVEYLHEYIEAQK